MVRKIYLVLELFYFLLRSARLGRYFGMLCLLLICLFLFSLCNFLRGVAPYWFLSIGQTLSSGGGRDGVFLKKQVDILTWLMRLKIFFCLFEFHKVM